MTLLVRRPTIPGNVRKLMMKLRKACRGLSDLQKQTVEDELDLPYRFDGTIPAFQDAIRRQRREQRKQRQMAIVEQITTQITN